MHKFRCPQHTWVHRLAACALTVLLVQGYVGMVWHFETVNHVWCDVHQQVTHDADHGATNHEAGHGTANATGDAPTANRSDGDHPGSPADGPRPNEQADCEFLSFVHDHSVSFPPVYAQLLNLPPPSVRQTVPAIPSSQTARPHPFGLRHVSPINSPPRA